MIAKMTETLSAPIISVIVPVYNVEAYLPKCLQSIGEDRLCLSGKIEVIVIDDGSSDASGRIAESFAQNHKFVRVMHQPNSGVASARNAGICAAQGEWLYFVDSDDWLAKGALTVLCEKCEKYRQFDILLFDAYQNTSKKEGNWEHFSREYQWNQKQELESLQRSVLYYPFPSAQERSEVPLSAPWDKVYRKRFLMGHHLCFQDKLLVLDDMVFNMEAFGEAYKVIYFKEKIYHYRYVSQSITNSYKRDRVDKDKKVWDFIGRYAKKQQEEGKWTSLQNDQFMQAFYCRIIKSFSICCRLQFFNRANRQSLPEKIRYVKAVLGEEPYRDAFKRVQLKNLEWKLKIVTIFGRWRWGMGIYFLHLAENGIRH